MIWITTNPWSPNPLLLERRQEACLNYQVKWLALSFGLEDILRTGRLGSCWTTISSNKEGQNLSPSSSDYFSRLLLTLESFPNTLLSTLTTAGGKVQYSSVWRVDPLYSLSQVIKYLPLTCLIIVLSGRIKTDMFSPSWQPWLTCRFWPVLKLTSC